MVLRDGINTQSVFISFLLLDVKYTGHENTSMSKSETTSTSNWKVIRDGESGKHATPRACAGKRSLSFLNFCYLSPSRHMKSE